MTVRTLKKAARAVTSAEARLADRAAEHRDSRPVRILSTIGEIGDQPQLRLLGGGLIAAGLLARRQRLAHAGVRMLLAHELSTAIKNFVKERVDRTRPRSAETKKQSHPRPGKRTTKEQTSFPSGHTAGAVAAAQAFAHEFPEHRHIARVTAGVVAGAQVPRCAHYPTDVGVGAIIGFAAERLVALLWKPVVPVRREEPLPPQPLV